MDGNCLQNQLHLGDTEKLLKKQQIKESKAQRLLRSPGIQIEFPKGVTISCSHYTADFARFKGAN